MAEPLSPEYWDAEFDVRLTRRDIKTIQAMIKDWNRSITERPEASTQGVDRLQDKIEAVAKTLRPLAV